MSTPGNMYEVLDDEGSAGAPVVKKGAKAAPAKKEQTAPVVEAKAPHQRVVTEDRARRGGREGAKFSGNRGGGRGGRGGRGGASDGSVRQFDRRGPPRRNAPGAAPKGGHGLGPQGGADFDADAFASAEQDAAVSGGENPIVSGGEEAAADAAAAAIEDLGVGASAEEEDNTLTYDQYLEKQKSMAVPEQFNIRQASNDDSKWKKVTALTKVDDEKKSNSNENDGDKPKKSQKSGKISLDEFVGDAPRASSRPSSGNFDRPSSGGRGGGRGGSTRGGPRGGARGGASRGGARGGNNPNVFDESAFPKLGGK